MTHTATDKREAGSCVACDDPADQEWNAYGSQRPESAGVYRWRVPSKAIAGMTVTFLGHMVLRNAGYSQVLAPYFAHWDGYRLIIPVGTEWQAVESPPKFNEYRCEELSVEGVVNAPCPFCGTVPKFKAVHSDYNGTFIHSEAHRYNSWWLECCRWACSPHMNDPRDLASARNAMLAERSKGTA